MPSKTTATPVNPGLGNVSLGNAKKNKADEFYTQLNDISQELRHYTKHLKGKVVLCNCDDPYESNFFKFFALNFNALGLKKLIATSYQKSPITGGQLLLADIEGLKPEGKDPYAIEINEVPDVKKRGTTDLTDVEYLLKKKKNTSRSLKGDSYYGPGDFRSKECVELLKESDVVVTNPPFSLFREYVSLLIEHEKKLLIIGHMNALHYREIFKLLKEDKLWLGQSIHSGDREFRVPDHYPLQAAGFRVDENGKKYIRVKGVRWFTNMDNPHRHEKLPLFKKYSPTEYPKYDNLDAIDVGKTSDIPCDYDGLIGVPDSFLDKFNPDQFSLIGVGCGDLGKEIGVTKNYRGRTDVAITIDGKSKCPYSRIIIKRKIVRKTSRGESLLNTADPLMIDAALGKLRKIEPYLGHNRTGLPPPNRTVYNYLRAYRVAEGTLGIGLAGLLPKKRPGNRVSRLEDRKEAVIDIAIKEFYQNSKALSLEMLWGIICKRCHEIS